MCIGFHWFDYNILIDLKKLKVEYDQMGYSFIDWSTIILKIELWVCGCFEETIVHPKRSIVIFQ